MNWKKALGFGLLFWVILFAVASLFAGMKWESTVMNIILAIIGGIISYVLAGFIKPTSSSQALSYGFAFVVVGLILDFIITTRFAPDIFGEWTLWFSYVLVLIAPTLRVKKSVMPM
ncbi:MAG: hypothetical protein A3B10_04000 [Candidatus Doudnabacteria bacterium RIFCSPLOWO2_01_FULL_44_21]|uniref:Uncharacterized protein n=1 Tax=Candidatus Doudnabacteria bacterium RIFCSPLOWO2_01_FULL_44_21 TaxID=1817841 RepID=A0A1F5Q513_9BACT|nr:MAG: hypothetical protein A3B95_00760 [Candidatus Doudnabacteria bacterium RIFCSPHIGHO2_02_FULL_43_13b]OGE97281.1 MAG: hypothetical protein A3B10_04000 [Candidatus Doudnabacteria bacterium RIFCSPLOWO2_01_FULL_44_21]